MVDTLAKAELVHAMPGRARLRIASRRGDTAFLAEAATGLSAIMGVHKVEVRPLTGSILVHHGPSLARIGEAAAKAGLFEIAEPASAAVPPASRQWATLPADPRIAAAIGLGLVTLWQLSKGKLLPPALTLAWYTAHVAGAFPTGGSLDQAE
jgi:hypothetical protein